MINSIEITLPPATVRGKTRYLPYSPNAKMHWALRSSWSKQWRTNAFYLTEQALREIKLFKESRPIKHIAITPYFFATFPQDPDNAIASLKPVIDGICDTGIVPDDSHEYLLIDKPQYEKVKKTKQKLSLLVYLIF